MIRDLNPEDIERLVSVSGMVTRCSNIIPEVRWALEAFLIAEAANDDAVPELRKDNKPLH